MCRIRRTSLLLALGLLGCAGDAREPGNDSPDLGDEGRADSFREIGPVRPLRLNGEVPSLDFTTEGISLRGMILVVDARWSGGCEDHEWELYWDGEERSEEGFVDEVTLNLVHDRRGDFCDSIRHGTLHFDLEELLRNREDDLIIQVYGGSENGRIQRDAVEYLADSVASPGEPPLRELQRGNETPSENFSVEHIELDGTTLVVGMSYPGCRSHDFNLFWNGRQHPTRRSPIVRLNIVHERNGDRCDSERQRSTVHFDLSSLLSDRDLTLNVYGGTDDEGMLGFVRVPYSVDENGGV